MRPPLHASSASAEPSLHCRSRLLAAPPQAWESAAAATSSGAAPPGGAARHFCCCPAGRSVVAAAAWQRGPSLLPLISGAAFLTMLTLELHMAVASYEYHEKINKEMHHSSTLTALTSPSCSSSMPYSYPGRTLDNFPGNWKTGSGSLGLETWPISQIRAPNLEP